MIQEALKKYDKVNFKLFERNGALLISIQLVQLVFDKDGIEREEVVDYYVAKDPKNVERILDTLTATGRNFQMEGERLLSNYRKKDSFVIENYDQVKNRPELQKFREKADKKLEKKSILSKVKNLKIFEKKERFTKIKSFVKVATYATVTAITAIGGFHLGNHVVDVNRFFPQSERTKLAEGENEKQYFSISEVEEQDLKEKDKTDSTMTEKKNTSPRHLSSSSSSQKSATLTSEQDLKAKFASFKIPVQYQKSTSDAELEKKEASTVLTSESLSSQSNLNTSSPTTGSNPNLESASFPSPSETTSTENEKKEENSKKEEKTSTENDEKEENSKKEEKTTVEVKDGEKQKSISSFSATTISKQDTSNSKMNKENEETVDKKEEETTESQNSKESLVEKETEESTNTEESTIPSETVSETVLSEDTEKEESPKENETTVAETQASSTVPNSNGEQTKETSSTETGQEEKTSSIVEATTDSFSSSISSTPVDETSTISVTPQTEVLSTPGQQTVVETSSTVSEDSASATQFSSNSVMTQAGTLSNYGMELASSKGTVFKSNSYADSISEQEKLKLAAIVAGEDSYSYEGSLAVVSTVLNRCDTARFEGYGGKNPYKQIVYPSQFTAANGNIAKSYMNHPDEIPDFVMAAVEDGLNGYRNHTYTAFRANRNESRQQIGDSGNWYFNSSAEVPNYGSAVMQVRK